EVLVGSGDDPRVHPDGSAFPHPADLPFLEHAQELTLDASADVSDLVEEERPAGRLLEQPAARPGCSGEAAARMPEPLALEHPFRDGAAVDGDECSRCPRAAGVDGA